MTANEITKSEQRFYFGTRGLTKDDILKIHDIFRKYDIDITYGVNEYKTTEVQSLIEICEISSASSMLANNLSDKDNSYVSLHVNAELSSWIVLFPREGGVKERAVVTQLFNEVKEVLVRRQVFFPRAPWKNLRDVIVFIPIVFLTTKVIFPSFHYEYLEILSITIFAAVFNYLISFFEIRRLTRRVIVVKPSLWVRLKAFRFWILATLAAAIISYASEKALEFISQYFAQ